MDAGKEKTAPGFSGASAALLTVQFAALAVLAATTRFRPPHAPALVLCLGAAGLGLWAVAAMGPRQLRPQAEVAPHARLRRHGPYAVIRHPMYAALLLGAAGLLTQNFSWGRFAAAGGLALALALKIRLEERRLTERFPEYAAYRRQTWRIVPGVW